MRVRIHNALLDVLGEVRHALLTCLGEPRERHNLRDDRVRTRSGTGGRMSLVARVKSWFRVSSRRADFEREMQDEMRIHLELYQADLRRRGLSEAEARRRAFADFGSLAGASGGMPRGRRPAPVRRTARRRRVRGPAPATLAGVHDRGPAVARTRDWRQYRHLQPDRHRAGEDTPGPGSTAIVLRR